MADDKNNDTTAPKGGDKPSGTIDPSILSQTDIASDVMGDNKLQGNDQNRVHNQRQDQADAKREPDEDTLEAFRKMDPKD
ncbi:hypothetical protein [Mangrovicella endophytica]|uniref:hypothetical protein n=1 Tax=Mangrovicella endophytica TaxID=2066697 RepID=UPI000C9E57F6|nr:hypothetical protein [Mangrovicella endophytica]